MPDRYPSVKEFLAAVKPFADEIEHKYGIPWLMCGTQAAHESRNGNSALALHNNLFGVTGDAELIKAGVPATMAMVDVKAWLLQHAAVQVVIMKTGEASDFPPEKIHYWTRPGDVISKTPNGTGSDLLVERPFRTYADWKQATYEWADKIVRLYPKAFIHAHDGEAEGFFQELQNGGYATDKKYAAQLIERYKENAAIV